MLRDLNDAWGWITKLMSKVDRLASGAILENSSITNGRMRFIGGLLLIDSGGTLQVVGHMNGEGDFEWTGSWAFTGNGDLTGDVDLTGLLEVLGSGRIKIGNVILEDGKITAGNITIDPNTEGGVVDFGGGRRVHAGSGYLGVYDGDRFVVFNSGGVTMYANGRSISVGVGGVRFSGLPTKSASSTGKTPNDAVFDESGFLYRIV
ncbi:hypothetical protein [Microbacterium binotii]|uniref:hypothetical protein n=1 Tax=Microbacterium binotii TaxID=462710 RepID=UPI001F39B965|nr:hypothetical protein [Microbacterium binotii]UIN31889.1 hypothetical protein LXM64_06800 [Microbacterium binotii]